MIIAIDFDSVIAHYDGWKGINHFGPVIDGARESIQKLKEQGHIIIIHTCRIPTPELKRYLDSNGVYYDFINENPLVKLDVDSELHRKLPADIYIDDKCITFRGGWHKTMECISEFKSWEPHDDYSKQQHFQ